jgi:hypothetical protein
VNRRLREVAARYEAQLDAAGTGDARYQGFRAQVVAFAEEWQRFFVPRVMAGTAIASAELGAVPEFRYVEDAAAERAWRRAVPLLVLAGLALAVAALGFGRLSRYPVVG